MAIARGALIRDQVREELVRRIDRAELVPGARINEVELAAELGVSRTPLKEALVGIEREGYLRPVPGRGFHVADLDADEIRQAYPILAALETLALRSAAMTPGTIAELRRRNAAFAAGRTPDELVRLDEAFHEALVESCGNRRLIALIAREKRVLRRYQAVYHARVFSLKRSVSDHEALVALLATGDRATAAALLEEQWRAQTDALVAAVTAR